MTTRRAPINDMLLKRALDELAAGADADRLATEVMWSVDSTAQARRPFWSPVGIPPRMVLVIAVGLLLAALAGAIAGGLIRLPLPDPPPFGLMVTFRYGSHPTDINGTYQPIEEVAVLDPQTGADAARGATGLPQLPLDGTGATQLSWSVDGSRLAYVRDFKVWITDQSGIRLVATCMAGQPCWADLSPDGTELVVNSGFVLSVVQVDSENQTAIGDFTTIGGIPEAVTWSPDAERVAVTIWTSAGYAIYVMNRDGTDLTRLDATWVAHGDATLEGGPWLRSLDWSPDGSRIAYLKVEALGYTRALLIAPVVGGALQVVDLPGARARINITGVDMNGVSWSPDGEQLALVFVSDVAYASLGLPDLFVINADGSGLRRLADNVGGTPAWRQIL